MMLLSFTVRNHKSLRDEVTLDLVRPSLTTLQPKAGDWASALYPLAGVFGANATGKSAILNALHYTFTAVRDSATRWQGARGMVREPFKLDGTHEDASSTYTLDFVHQGRRHEYEFEVDRHGIKREVLRDVPTSRWRTLVERDRERAGQRIKLHSSVRAFGEVTARELLLSRAHLLKHPQLGPIARDLIDGFDIVLVKDSHRAKRLAELTESLSEGVVQFEDLQALLQIADIGVTDVAIQEEKVPADVMRAILARYRLANATSEDETRDVEAAEAELDDDDLEAVARHLIFTHRGKASNVPAFSIEDESDGTIAWLSIAVPALEVLRRGGLLAVDEIDASLHPHLLDLLLGAFADPEVNTKGAQLVFTSHESYVLSPMSETEFAPEQVWFTDKTRDGVTELTCLADFPRHPDANVAKRYLAGRYGGTPRLSPALLSALVDAGPFVDREGENAAG